MIVDESVASRLTFIDLQLHEVKSSRTISHVKVISDSFFTLLIDREYFNLLICCERFK
jgi:hypothetical protein